MVSCSLLCRFSSLLYPSVGLRLDPSPCLGGKSSRGVESTRLCVSGWLPAAAAVNQYPHCACHLSFSFPRPPLPSASLSASRSPSVALCREPTLSLALVFTFFHPVLLVFSLCLPPLTLSSTLHLLLLLYLTTFFTPLCLLSPGSILPPFQRAFFLRPPSANHPPPTSLPAIPSPVLLHVALGNSVVASPLYPLSSPNSVNLASSASSSVPGSRGS